MLNYEYDRWAKPHSTFIIQSFKIPPPPTGRVFSFYLVFSVNSDQSVSQDPHLQPFQALFDSSISELRRYAYFQLGDEEAANDTVQEAFVKLWEIRQTVDWSTAKGLLYRMVSNQSKNQLKHRSVRLKFHQSVSRSINHESPDFQLEEQEFKAHLEDCLAQLPEPSRVAFLMNRIESLKYKQIAETLAISVKAVEKRMSIAIPLLTGCVGKKV